MEILVEIMRTFSLTKLVLTVFTSNVNALEFYRSLGFLEDDTSPEASYYRILSKRNADLNDNS